MNYMKINTLCIIASAMLFTSCAASLTSSIQKTYAPLDYRQEVRVFEIDEQTPPNAEKLGTVKVGDSGFSTDCDYDVVIEKAKTETRKAGGNALKITKHSLPDIWSSCHRITADVLKVEDIENYAVSAEPSETDSALIGADYANYKYKDEFPHFRFALDGGWQYRTDVFTTTVRA
jgi:hypothetical protein